MHKMCPDRLITKKNGYKQATGGLPSRLRKTTLNDKCKKINQVISTLAAMGFQPRKSYAPPDERQEMGMFFYKMSMLFTLFRRVTRQ